MTPQMLREFIVGSPKPDDWTNTDAYGAWREYIDGLGEKHGRHLLQLGSSANDAYHLVAAGADAEEILAVFTLLFL